MAAEQQIEHMRTQLGSAHCLRQVEEYASAALESIAAGKTPPFSGSCWVTVQSQGRSQQQVVFDECGCEHGRALIVQEAMRKGTDKQIRDIRLLFAPRQCNSLIRALNKHHAEKSFDRAALNFVKNIVQHDIDFAEDSQNWQDVCNILNIPPNIIWTSPSLSHLDARSRNKLDEKVQSLVDQKRTAGHYTIHGVAHTAANMKFELVRQAVQLLKDSHFYTRTRSDQTTPRHLPYLLYIVDNDTNQVTTSMQFELMVYEASIEVHRMCRIILCATEVAYRERGLATWLVSYLRLLTSQLPYSASVTQPYLYVTSAKNKIDYWTRPVCCLSFNTLLTLPLTVACHM